eukprot:TRINITY_DN1236_c1_g1_i13.p1 TRINITY_DN1236_c1_g1~~TRINITY_DN1236_c1_g1_i13.p1  ORF type:complete len:230 (-),score=-0.33 TRINITY_DN1236_c1_g1_i13:276-965(-)
MLKITCNFRKLLFHHLSGCSLQNEEFSMGWPQNGRTSTQDHPGCLHIVQLSHIIFFFIVLFYRCASGFQTFCSLVRSRLSLEQEDFPFRAIFQGNCSLDLLEVMNLQELQKNLAAARLLALQQSQSEQTQFFQQFRASERALEQKVGNSNVHHETTQKELLLIVIIFFIKILQIEKHVRDLQKYFAMKGYKFSMLALYIDVIGYILSMIFVYSCSDRLHVLHTFEFFIS